MSSLTGNSISNDQFDIDIEKEKAMEDDNTLTDEDKRLGGSPALKTTLVLSAGPLISQIASALYGIINTIWISRALGEIGMSAISTYQNFDTFARSFASFLQVSATAKISSLYGSGQSKEASQVFSDLLRISIICGLITPAIGIPACYPCVKWFGASDEVADMGYDYIVPLLSVSFIPCIFLVCCGSLQAEGRSWLFSITQVAALVMDCLLFCPLFLLGIKTGISGSSYALALAELIPSVIIITMFYLGKFGIKPHPRELIRMPSPHTWGALKVGLPQLIFQLSLAIPGILIRKIFGLACNSDTAVFNHIMAAYNVFNRLWNLISAIPNAINIGFIPAASYAYSADRSMRVIRLLVHATWIAVAWGTLCMILCEAAPRQLASIFSSSPEYLDWSEIVLRNGNWGTFVAEVPGIIISLLQAMKKGAQAISLSFLVHFLPIPLFSSILYFTDTDNLPRIVYCYPLQAAWGTVISLPFAIFAIRKIFENKGKMSLFEIMRDDDIPTYSANKKNRPEIRDLPHDKNEKEVLLGSFL